MQFSFLPTGAGYVYRLGDAIDPDLLTIEVTNIRQRAGSLYALLTTSTFLPDARLIPGTQTVLHAEVWLLSDRSRNEYAASLSRLIPTPDNASGIDFAAIVAQVGRLVMTQETGEVEVTRLNGNVRQQPTAYLVEGILPVRKPTILYGAGGVGKSIFAASVAVAVQHGVRFLGKAVQQAEVLYLDWETDADDIGQRMHAAGAGLGVADPSLRYVALVRPLEDRISQLSRIVAEQKIGLVVIDSVGMAMPASSRDSDAAETAIRFFRSLRALNAAVLAIDHVSGEDMRRVRGGAGKPYGSVYKWNSARNAFELRTSREPDMHGTHLLLKHRKTNVGPLLRDTPITLIWDDSRGVATFGLDLIPAVAAPNIPLPDQIADILVVAPATPHQIADMLSQGETVYQEFDVRRILKQMLVDGKVRAGSDGTVRIATDSPDAVQSPWTDT